MTINHAFGTSLADLAREGIPPVVFMDCLRFLSKRSLKNSQLFAGEVDKPAVHTLKQSYEEGRRPLRSRKSRALFDDAQVANLLLVWLGSLPHPLLPVEHSWHLANLAGNVNGTNGTNGINFVDAGKGGSKLYSALKSLIHRTEPFILEVLFPLFELLHHFHLNGEHREESLRYLSTIFTPSIFGTKEDHGLHGANYDALLRDACSLMIKEYRGLFMSQPELSYEHHAVGNGDFPEHNKENVDSMIHELDSMISLTFENIIKELDGEEMEASPQKKCKINSRESSASFLFMNQHMPFEFGGLGSETTSPTSVL